MLSGGFGVTEFQLVLLRRMADYQPLLVERARNRLGASRSDMRAANARWQALIRSRRFPSGLRRFRLVLGPPGAETERRVGDLACQVCCWPLPLWPDLLFEVLAGPDGTVLGSWLVRPPGTPMPSLIGRADLTPWSCVVSDVDAAFPPAEHREGSAPSRWTVAFNAPDGAGRPVPLLGHFVWGLLQTVEEAPLRTGAQAGESRSR